MCIDPLVACRRNAPLGLLTKGRGVFHFSSHIEKRPPTVRLTALVHVPPGVLTLTQPYCGLRSARHWEWGGQRAYRFRGHSDRRRLGPASDCPGASCFLRLAPDQRCGPSFPCSLHYPHAAWSAFRSAMASFATSVWRMRDASCDHSSDSSLPWRNSQKRWPESALGTGGIKSFRSYIHRRTVLQCNACARGAGQKVPQWRASRSARSDCRHPVPATFLTR